MAAEPLDRPGAVAILDAEGMMLRTIEAHEGEVDDVALAADGSRLITAGVDGWLRAWDPDNGGLLWQLHRPSGAEPEVPHTVSLDATGSLVAAGWPDAGRILLADARTGRVIGTFPCLPSSCQGALSPDGTRIAIAGKYEADGIETGWIVPIAAPGPRVRFEAPPWTGINGRLSWSPDGTYLSGSSFVWDTETGRLLHTAERGLVSSSSWSPDANRLVTGSGTSAQVWDIDPEFRPALSLTAASGSPVTGVAFANGDRVVTASDALRLWDVRPLGNEERSSLSLPTEYSSQLAFTTQERLVITADADEDRAGFVTWDLGAPSKSFGPNPGLASQHVDVNPIDGSLVLVSGRGVRLVTDNSVRRLPLRASHASWTPDGAHLIVTPTDASVTLVGLDGREVWRAEQPFSFGTFVVAPDGRIAIAGGDASPDQRVIILNGVDGSTISTLTLPTNVLAVAFDPRGREIVTYGVDLGPLQTWDIDTGRRIGTYPAETSGQPGFAFSPDGATLAVVGADQAVRLYDADSRQLRMTLPPPDDLLGDGPTRASGDPRCHANSLAFSRDGSLLAAQGCAGVRVFALDIDELLAIARANVTRSLTADECRLYLHVEPCPSA